MAATRRQFLSGAAAATAGVALLNTRAAAEETHPHDGDIDERVAMDFLNAPLHQDSTETASNRIVGLLYGLICTDLKLGEALLPYVGGIDEVKPHIARLWVKTGSIVDASEIAATATGTDGSMAVTYFDIAGYSVSFKPIDGSGNELPEPSTSLKKRNSDRNPWMHIKWVRCLKKLTGLKLISDTDRNKKDLVTTRVRLKPGKIAAVPPYSRDGQNFEWRVKQGDGKVVVSATTDSMLWSRVLSSGVANVKVTLTDLGGTAQKKIVLKLDAHCLSVAITHATTADHTDRTKQTDSIAFARLLEGGNPATYPVPVMEGSPEEQAYVATASAEDVHCECASCP